MLLLAIVVLLQVREGGCAGGVFGVGNHLTSAIPASEIKTSQMSEVAIHRIGAKLMARDDPLCQGDV